MTGPFDVEAADEQFRQLQASHHCPGLLYVVCADGRILHHYASGVTSLRTRTPVTLDTKFRIASMTKSFAAAALFILRDRGLCTLSMPLAAVLGDDAGSLGNDSLYSLLTMTADLPTDDPWADRLLDAENALVCSLLAGRIAREGLSRFRCSYSNLSYMALGLAIATLAKKSAMRFIEEELLEPLGLTGTTWNPPHGDDTSAALGYVRRPGGCVEETRLECRGDGAVFGGLWSTAGDIARWMQFLSGTVAEDDRILARASRDELSAPQALMQPVRWTSRAGAGELIEHAQYCFGLRANDIDKLRFVGHSGGLPGYGSHMRWCPESGLSIAAFANSTYCPVWETCREVLLAAEQRWREDHPIEPSARLRRAADNLLGLLAAWSDAEAERIFAANALQDKPLEERRVDLGRACSLLEEESYRSILKPQSAGRAELILESRAWRVVLSFSLTPLADDKVQALAVEREERLSAGDI